MANNVTDLGKVGITMKGEWSSSTAYERLDGVMYNGSLWIALADNTNSTPSINNSNWMLSAQHGEFTEQQLEDFKAEVVAESKEEMDDYTDDKKAELDTYEGTKETELDTYANGLKDDFDTNATLKTTAFNDNATAKTTAFNTNATNKTTDFNDNATAKTTSFNSNASDKTETFNSNATSKTGDFDSHVTSKTTDFDTHVTEKTTAFDEHVDDKIDEFDENAEEMQQEIDELSANMPWANPSQATSIDITDAAKYSRNKMQIFGNTEQASYNGNQLLDVAHPNTPGSKITYTFENDILTVSATNRSYSSITYNITDIYKSNSEKRLYFNFENIVASEENGNKVQINIRKNDNTSQYVTLVNSSLNKSSHLIPNDVTDIASVVLGIYSNNTNVVEDSSIVITKPMLQFGTETLDYEPYTNGPAPNPDYPQDIHVVTGNNTVGVTGKNLFNGIYQDATVGGSNGRTYQTSLAGSTAIIPCLPNTTYTIKKYETSNRFRVYDYPEFPTGGTSLNVLASQDAQDTLTVTTNANANYLVVYVSSSTEIYKPKMQIEEGPTATLYEPYYHQDYSLNLGSLELCKIGNYQDYIYKNNGNWYKYNAIGKVVLDGSENWQSQLTSNKLIYYIKIDTAINDRLSPILNNIGIYNDGLNRNYSTYISQSGNLNYRCEEITEVSEFKTMLSNRNMIVYYILKTPTSIQITDETLISQLEAIYNHFTLTKGINHITITPSDLAPYVTLNYMQDLPSKLENLASRIELLEE